MSVAEASSRLRRLGLFVNKQGKVRPRETARDVVDSPEQQVGGQTPTQSGAPA